MRPRRIVDEFAGLFSLRGARASKEHEMVLRVECATFLVFWHESGHPGHSEAGTC